MAPNTRAQDGCSFQAPAVDDGAEYGGDDAGELLSPRDFVLGLMTSAYSDIHTPVFRPGRATSYCRTCLPTE